MYVLAEHLYGFLYVKPNDANKSTRF